MSEVEDADVVEGLEELASSAADDLRRLKALHAKGKLQENLAAEVVSTILPLLAELSGRVAEHAASLDEWAEGVDDALDGVAPPEGPSLEKEEILLISWLLDRLGDLIEGAKQAPQTPKDVQEAFLEIEVKLKLGRAVVSRLTEELEDDEEDPGLAQGEGNEADADTDEPS